MKMIRSEFYLARECFEEALTALQRLGDDEYGGVQIELPGGDERTLRDVLQGASSPGDFLALIGWVVVLDGEDNICEIEFVGEHYCESSLQCFRRLSPHVREGSYIEVVLDEESFLRAWLDEGAFTLGALECSRWTFGGAELTEEDGEAQIAYRAGKAA